MRAPGRLGSRLLRSALAWAGGLSLCSLALSSAVAASGGLQFDGVNDYVTFGQATNLGTATFTLEAWVRRTGDGAVGTSGGGGVTAVPLITKGRSESDGNTRDCNYFFGLRGTNFVLAADFESFLTNNNNNPVFGRTSLATGIWYHVAATYDGTNWALYLNGALETNVVSGQTPRYDTIQHAALATALNSTGSPNGYFAGVMDEVRIWNYARTADQIASNSAFVVASAPGLIGRWALDDGSGLVAANTGSTGVSGTLTNGPVWTTGRPFPPVVALTSPTNGALLNGPLDVLLEASASDTDGGITNLAFFAGATRLADVASPPFVFTWTNAPLGTHALTAVAWDDGGVGATSGPVVIQVQDAVVQLSAPTNGALLYFPGSATLTAAITEVNGPVSQVQFFAGATLLATLTAAPWTTPWTLSATGAVTLTAVATDASGMHTSAPVQVTVASRLAPTASLTSPTNNARVITPGTVTLTASAADADGTVVQVAFLTNGVLLAVDTTSPYSVAWVNPPDGVHTITVVATDSDGLTNEPVAVTVTAGTNTPPAVAITAPANGASLLSGSNLVVTASASDAEGTVASVEFFLDGFRMRTDTAAPHNWTWNNAPLGTYVLTALATDNLGATNWSAPVTVTVAFSASGTNTLIAQGSAWHYRDTGVDPGSAWTTLAYDDSGWAEGLAQLGYGDGDEATVVGFGPSSTNKYLTTWFRRTWMVSDPSLFGSLLLRVQRDDGAVIYVNGVEVARQNMPDGVITSTTPAAGNTTSETTFFTSGFGPEVLVAGTNVIAVQIHQDGVTSSDISFDLQLLGLSGAAVVANLTRGPYLQNATTQAVVVRWRTDVPASSVLRYGTNLASLDLVLSNAASTTEHVVTVSNLLADTRYYYAIEAGTNRLAGAALDYHFRTLPPPGVARPTRLWVLGDSGTGDNNARNVRNAYTNLAGTTGAADLVLMLGDNAYDSGTDTEHQAAIFDLYPTILRNTVLWPTIGNHETAQSRTATSFPYLDIFTLPRAGEAGGVPSGTERYYSFDYANIHILCLDSMTSGQTTNTTMFNWVINDLQTTTQQWIIAFWHHPPYTKGSHDSDAESDLVNIRQNWLPVLESYGVDLVMCGHSHSYERSYLLQGHYGFSSSFNSGMQLDAGNGRTNGTGAYVKTSGDGTIYITAGSSGKISGGSLNHPAMFVSTNRLGSLFIDVLSNRLDLRMLGTSVVHDTFTLIKDFTDLPSITLTSPTNGAVRPTPGVISITANASDGNGTVTQVDFFTNGVLFATDTTKPYAVAWTNPPAGEHVLTAAVTDNDGQTNLSAAAAITVVINTAPTASITSPSPGATLLSGTNLTVTASAADADGSVARVDFYVDGILRGTDATAPFSFVWTNLPLGSATLLARATDNLGTTNWSAPVAVSVGLAYGATNTLISQGAVWRYLDTGTDPATNWTTLGFDDGDWLSGPAQLGYGDGDETTVVSYGFDSTDVFITTWFRRAWVVDNAARFTSLELRLLRDDGAVVYLNGVEVARQNMPAGVITSSTLTPASTSSETAFFTSALSAAGLVTGTNVLAVEVHQSATTSSDLSFDLQLLGFASVNTAPAVALASPTNGVTLASPGVLEITATATDSDGTVTQVAFYTNGVLFATDTTAPHGVAWTNPPAGAQILTAVATDNDGATNLSAAVSVTVTVANGSPSVALSSPTNNASVTTPGVLEITATAADSDGTVTQVAFYTNGVLFATDTVAPYAVTWTNPPAGAHTLTAAATDNDGATNLSAAVSITATTGNSSPTVAISAPATGASLLSGSNLTVTATAADSDGAVVGVEFYVDGTRMAADTNAPYAFTWTNAPLGAYTLTARATDNQGATAWSDPVAVTVAFAASGTNTLVAQGSAWRYRDTGVDPGTNWVSAAYDDSAWPVGLAQLGFGDGDEATLVGFGGDSNNVHITTWFRRAWVVSDPGAFTDLQLRLLRDDGAVVYLNGVEVARQNMPAGPITSSTLTPASTSSETTFFVSTFGVENLVAGTNVLAVEVHQSAVTSSDLSFDLQLIGLTLPNTPPSVALSSPTNNASVSTPGLLEITATASDADGTVAQVAFFTNGVLLAIDTAAPYAVTWTNPPAGAHTLTAAATDNEGATNLSAAVSITAAAGNSSPTVAISAPATGASLLSGSNLTVTATAADGDGTVVGVEFYVDDTRMATATNAPYAFTWTNAPLGAYTLTARATDNEGATAWSDPVAVTVAFAANGTNTLVAQGSAWRYRDSGVDPGAGWTGLAYNDSAWSVGLAQFGYGDGDEATVVGYGPSSTSRYITTWFRRAWVVSNPALFNALQFRVLRDDGVVVYLNGVEVVRQNMPSGTVAASTLASSAIAGADETTFFSTTVGTAALVAGTNVIAVELHQSGASSSDISFDLQLIGLSGDAPPAITRGPYLQNATPGSAVVRWRTDLPTNSVVRYGTNLASLDASIVTGAAITEHVVTVSNLLADTRYYYAVEAGTNRLAGGTADHYFTTLAPAGTARPTRLWVLGDSGTGNSGARAVRDAYTNYAAANGPADLWLMLGDNAYNSGTDSEHQTAVFDLYPTILRNTVLWPTIGNHETAQSRTATSFPYLDIFTLPQGGEAGGVPSGTERYYSFDYANIHFLCLDSMTSGQTTNTTMFNWVINDLQTTTQEWIIAFWHHPPYTKGSHNSDTESDLVNIRQNWLPVLESYGVDLVLSGHSHCYERSHLLKGHFGLSSTLQDSMKLDAGDGRTNGTGPYLKSSGDGTVYIVAGNGGQATGGTLNHPAMFLSLNQLGSLIIDVHSNRLDLQMLGTASVGDTFTLLKQPAPAPAFERYPQQGFKARQSGFLASGYLGVTNAGPASAGGGTISLLNDWILYSPAPGYDLADTFDFRVTNGFGQAAPAVASVTVTPDTRPTGNLAVEDLGNGSFRIRGSGIPGRTYALQYSATPEGPLWQALATVVADAQGVFEHVDTPPGGPRHYRTASP
ncbi:MAG: hypothetical protein RJA22_510 [Verrucomicrobiota bacterium]